MSEGKKVMNKLINEVEKDFSEVWIRVQQSEESREPAFAFFNRDINWEHVNLIFEKMKIKGYRSSEPIQIIKAEEAIKSGMILVDLNKRLISKDQYQFYYLVIEGQHRTYAVSKYNDWLTDQGKETIKIPAVEVEFIKDETITDYLNEINITQKEWTKEDYLKGAANVFEHEPLLQKYKELIKTALNPSGFSLSTLNLIYCNGASLTRNDFILLCSGEVKKGKTQNNIIPGYDLETGDNFIEICKNVGFRNSEITKRYLIKEFNRIKNGGGGSEKAIKIFKSMTNDDAQAMLNNNEHLDENKVIIQIEIVKQRYYSKQTTVV